MVLSVRNISKSYGPIKALNGVSLTIEKGSIFGILGPNGSGKTTLLGILLSVLKMDEGSFEWFDGTEHAAARKRIGAFLETPNFYPYLNAVRNLEINAGIKGVAKTEIDKAIELVGLSERKTSKFHTYSLGMKQRLAIGNALLGQPEVLLLDEPTNGLDPEGIAEIRQLILDLRARGVTIIMASHLLDEVEKVCSHVAILQKGNLLVSGSVEELFQNEQVIEVAAEDMKALEGVLASLRVLKSISRQGNMLRVTVEEGFSSQQLNAFCFEQGLTLSYLNKKKKSLEAEFMELTRKN
jgi:ABC-2 type transport system ATP-binding protein